MKKKILSLFFSLISVGCSSLHWKASEPRHPERILITDNSDLKFRDNIGQTDVHQDIDLLVYALRWGYVGQGFIDRKILEAVVEKLREIPLKLKYPTNSKVLVNAIDAVLMTVPDNHLHAESLAPGGYPKGRAEVARKASVGKNVHSGKGKPWSLQKVSDPRGPLPVLAITSFPPSEDPVWKTFSSDVEKWLRNSIVILDLRGNEGGSDQIPFWLASRVLGKKVPSIYVSRESRLSPEAVALQANNFKFTALWRALQKQPVADYLLKEHAKWLNDFEAVKVKMTDGYEKETYDSFGQETALPPFSGKMFVLTDADCASAGEAMVEAIQFYPGTITVGESTAGYLNFGNIGVLLLPHSQVHVALATSYFKYKNPKAFEKSGVPPEVQVPAGTDALEYVLTKLMP